MKSSCYERQHDREALLRDLLEQGWKIREMRKGGYFIQTPDGKHGTALHTTTSDKRAGKNFNAAIRRMRKNMEEGHEIF